MNRFYSLLLFAMLSPLLLSAQEWRALGPWGGNISQLVKDSATGSYLAAVWPWMWRYDEEAGWTTLINLYELEVPAAFSAMIASPEGIYMLGSTNYLYFSEDAGQTWSLQHTFPSEWTFYLRFAVVGNRLYTHSDRNDLMASDDRGVTWTRVDSAASPASFATDGDIIYSCGGYGLYRRNSGGGWTLIGPRSMFGARLFPRGDTLVHWDGTSRLNRSLDAGESWSEMIDSTIDYLTVHNGTIWKVGGGGLFSMPIDGDQWTRRSDFGEHSLYGIDFLSDGPTLLIASVLGIQIWDDRVGLLAPFDATLNATPAGALRLAGDTILASVPYGFAYTDDGGEEWEQWRGPTGGMIERLATGNDRLYATTYSGGSHLLYVSDNQGRTWEPRTVDSARGFKSMAVYASGDTVVVGGLGFHRSTDRGETWERSAMVPTTRGPNAFVGKGGTIFGTEPGTSRLLFRTTDAGLTWDSVTQAAPLRLLGFDGRTLYEANATDGLRRSTDLGTSWETMSGPFPKYFNGVDSSIAPMFVSGYGDTIIAGFVDRVYGKDFTILFTTDGGAVWKRLAMPPRMFVGGIIIDGDRLLATTDHGFFATTHSLGVPAARGVTGDALHLAIDEGGRATWRSARHGDYRIDLYALTGEHVTLLADGEAAGGTHPLPLDDLPAGAYLCVLQCGGESAAVVVTAR